MVHYLPDGVNDMLRYVDVAVIDRQLEVAHLTVEGRGHLAIGERHVEAREQSEAEDLQVVRQFDGTDDGTRTEIYQCAGGDVPLLQVEVDVSLAA